jgi:hypothetical protein
MAFHLVNTPVRVPTIGGIVVLLPAWDNPATHLGPFAEDVPEMELVRPRNIQLVPGYLAALLVHRRGVTAMEAYQEILAGAL